MGSLNTWLFELLSKQILDCSFVLLFSVLSSSPSIISLWQLQPQSLREDESHFFTSTSSIAIWIWWLAKEKGIS